MKLVLHPEVASTVDRLSRNLPQASLLTGVHGVGLSAIAHQLAADNLAATIYPEGKGNTIGIAVIRQLYEQTRSKQSTAQIVIIDDADRMSHSAQTAFLKLLEEPSESTYFILTSHASQHLLPTIRSRLQSFHIRPALDRQTEQMIQDAAIKLPAKRTQLQFIAAGLPAELQRLMDDEIYFRQRAAIMSDARSFLQESTYQKMLVVNSYQKDRAKTLKLIEACLSILRLTLSKTPQPELISQLSSLEDTYRQVQNNASCRLQLTKFVL